MHRIFFQFSEQVKVKNQDNYIIYNSASKLKIKKNWKTYSETKIEEINNSNFQIYKKNHCKWWIISVKVWINYNEILFKIINTK